MRFAVIGQGHFAQTSILPAFENARGAELVALFSDDATKLRALRRTYEVEYALPYDQLGEFPESGAVDAVYVAVPNDLHASFTELAATAGVHVLCEKPIAASDQVAPELEELAACIRQGRDPEPSGREGLADLVVIEAIESAARSGRRVEIARVFPERRPTLRQARRKPPHGRVRTVNVQPPSQQRSS